jgi:hypothetical protein
VKEQLRRLLQVDTVDQARHQKMILGCYVLAADMDGAWRLWNIAHTWRPAIEVLIYPASRTPAPRPRTPIKQIKRISVNRPGMQEFSLLLSSHPAHQRRPTRGVNPLTRQGTTVNCE